MSAIRQVLRNGAFMNNVRRSYHADSSFKRPTMDDLPVPNGSWKTNHDAKNSKYNMHLLFGIAFTVITLTTAKMSGLVYFNYNPPKSID